MADDAGKKRRGRKKGDPRNKRGAKKTTPEEFMGKMLVAAGPRVDCDDAETIEAEPVDASAEFGKRREYIDPVEFCQAVINNNEEVLSMCGVREPIGLEDKLAAAKIAAPYTNKKKPTETLNKYEFSWAEEIQAAEQRATQLRMDIENDRPSAETTH